MLESRYFFLKRKGSTVFVLLSCFNDMTYCSPAWLVNNRNVFFTIQEVGKFKNQGAGRVGWVMRNSFLLPRWPFFFPLSVFSHNKKGKEALWRLFFKGIDPVIEGSTLMT